MRKAALLISILWLIALLASCGQGPEPTSTPSSTPSPALTPPTPTSTPLPPSPSPTATPRPTSTPTPTPTPADAGWNRYPNALDFRAIEPHDGDLWLGALSGLIHLDMDRSRWTAFTESDGLVNNSVSSLVVQDSWLWIGTLGGISRYDLARGTWRSYTTDSGLSGNQILRIYSDGDTIWAGTPNGLSWYKPADDTWDSLFAIADTELAGVEDITGDQDTLWITVSPYADDRGGLFMLDRETGEWTPISQTTSIPPVGSYQLVSGPTTLWAIPSAGLPWEHNKQTSTWRPLSELDPDGPEPGDAYVGGQFHAGALWLYAEHTGSLVRYEPQSHSVSSYPAAPLVALGKQTIMAGYENTLWYGGDEGLLAFRLDTGEWKPERRVVGALYRIYGERGGDLLVSSDLGPGFWNPADLQWRPLAPVGGTGLFATQGAAMEQGIPGVWLIERLTLEPDTDGPPQLAFFSEPGVEPQRFDLAPPAGWELVSLLPNAVGDTVWFLGTRGFLSYNPAVDQWGVFEIAQEPLEVNHTRQQNAIVWYVTDTDLGRFDTSSAELSLISLPITPTLAHEPALAVSEQELWLLLDDSIYHLVSEGDWLPVSTAAPCLDGADNLAFWNGALWLGGKQGVGSLAWPPSEEAPAWRCYGPANGMLDAEFEQIVPTRDELWFLHSQRGLWSFSGN